MKHTKRDVENTLHSINRIHGKGEIVAVVWCTGSNYMSDYNHGLAVRQMQLGNMDAREFRVSGDFNTVRFLQHDRLVLRIKKAVKK
jgi:hypothetical protein